jgi:hypothetical protein
MWSRDAFGRWRAGEEVAPSFGVEEIAADQVSKME